MKSIFLSQTQSDENTWNEFNKNRKFQNGLSQRLGDFHEQLAGKLPGYRTLPESHWSGLDVIKNDRTQFFEWKNSTNVSTDTLTLVYRKFQKLLDENKTNQCILVIVNVPDKWKAPQPIIKNKNGEPVIDLTGPEYKDRVFIVSGREAYAVMSGRSDFFDSLVKTVYNTFKRKGLVNTVADLSIKMNIDA